MSTQGLHVSRQEDLPILTGEARYIDDIVVQRMLHAVMVRSHLAHARILNIDVDEALALPGVHAVLTGSDLDEVAAQPIIWDHIKNQQRLSSKAMARERVRFVGQIVAAVVADTPALAEDAAELVVVDYEELPVVTSIEQALAPDAVVLHEDWGTNVFGSDRHVVGDFEDIRKSAAVVTEETFHIGRQYACPMETRGCVATWDQFSGALDIWISAQSPNRVRELLAEVLLTPLNRIRVRVPSIGGGFGCKADFYPEEVIVSLLARMTQRPIKWIEDRRESFLATVQAREQSIQMRLASDADGRLLGLQATITAVLGGEIGTTGMGPAWLASRMLPGGYDIPTLDVTVRGVVTNKTPYGAYRGWGQPKANFAMERMINAVASATGLSANTVRRRNFHQASQFPVPNGMGPVYDSGDYTRCLDLAEQTIAEAGWYERRQSFREQGIAAGIGFAFFVESTAAGPSKAMADLGLRQGGFDTEVVRMDSSGAVTIYTGQTAMGQGIETALSDVCAKTIGISKSAIRVVFGDTETCPYTGYGTGGSRAGALGGAAVAMAATQVREQLLGVASHMLEVEAADLVIEEGEVRVAGTDVSIPVSEVAFSTYRGVNRIGDGSTPTLEGRAVFDPPAQAYSYGCAVAFVEADRETGLVRVTDYALAHDCGTVLNETVVEGQLRGGSAQGLAGALYEELIYDDSGQPLTTTFMDYLLPTAVETPDFLLAHTTTPSPNIPGGMKGVGEAGVMPSYAVVADAIEDALDLQGPVLTRVPFTPERVFDALSIASETDAS
jgi:aerobic carbon-monoxide dehydrogenase large subunit